MCVCVCVLPAQSWETYASRWWQTHSVGQNHIYTVYIRYFWQGNHQLYGHTRCIYSVLANPTHTNTQIHLHIHMHIRIHTYIGLARTVYIRCIYGIFGREITIHTVMYGMYIRFWPTLLIITSAVPCFNLDLGHSTDTSTLCCSKMAHSYVHTN